MRRSFDLRLISVPMTRLVTDSALFGDILRGKTGSVRSGAAARGTIVSRQLLSITLRGNEELLFSSSSLMILRVSLPREETLRSQSKMEYSCSNSHSHPNYSKQNSDSVSRESSLKNYVNSQQGSL